MANAESVDYFLENTQSLYEVESERPPIPERQTRSQIYQEIAASTGLKRREVEAVFDAMRQLAARHLAPAGSGQFSIPGLVKIKRVMRGQTKKRMMLSPLTKTLVEIPSKPSRPDVKFTALKPLKDMLGGPAPKNDTETD